jgi:hypothetical protein
MPQADTPFTPSAAHLERIRLRAYHLWQSEGCPSGQSEAYWERARALDALATECPVLLPDPDTSLAPRTADGVLIEEAALEENLGEFPSLFTDQGDSMPTPESRKIARQFRDGER